MCELFSGAEPRFAVAENVISFTGLCFAEAEETLSSVRTWNQMEGIHHE